MHLGERLAATAMVVGVMAAATLTPTASAASGCDRYASTTGSDTSGTGALNHPLASVEALDGALKPGQTGCLLGGTYGSVSSTQRMTTNGTAGQPVTITSAPGQQAKVVGLIEVEGAYTTVADLSIDGSNNLYASRRSGTNCAYPVSNGLEIDGAGDVFENNDFYQSVASLRGNGIGIGWNHPADNAIIRANRIHDLGQCQAFDQMIYLAHGTGVQIYDNWMWNDRHGWGIQVYPGASGAHIYDNVIDGAGSGIVLGGSTQVAHNAIDHNVIMDSTGLPDAGLAQGVGVSTCCGLGSGNSFTDNVVFNNPGGIASASGVTLNGNTTAAPNLADTTSHDYRMTSRTPSALTGWSLWDGGSDDGPAAVAASGHTHGTVTRTRRRHARRRPQERTHARHSLGARFRVSPAS